MFCYIKASLNALHLWHIGCGGGVGLVYRIHPEEKHKAHLHAIETQQWVLIECVVLESFESISWAGAVLNSPET